MKLKKITAFLCSTVLAASLLAGCGGVNNGAAVATIDGQKIEYGLMHFVARLEQANSDDFYTMYYGQQGMSFWKNDNGEGIPMDQALAEDVLNTMQEIYTLEKHMEEYNVSLTEEEQNAISQAASAFLAANSKKALKALGAEQAYVEEYLRLSTIQQKMKKAIIANVDTNVTDEEAKTGTYSYVEISKSSESQDADTVAADLEQLKTQASAFADAAGAGTLEAAAEEYGHTVSTGTFKADDDSVDAEVVTALGGLKESEVSGLIETADAYFVVRLDAELDREATDETKESIIEEREETLYSETVEKWKEDSEWTIDEDVLAKISFDNLFTTTPESSESTESVPEGTEPVVDATEE